MFMVKLKFILLAGLSVIFSNEICRYIQMMSSKGWKGHGRGAEKKLINK